MFEKIRQSIRDAMSRASTPDERRAVVSMMRDALVEAKVAVAATRADLEAARARLVREQTELSTAQRRGRMAAEIGDQETVRVAAQFEKKHGERVIVLERKIAALEAELGLGEQEMEEMRAQMRAAGVPPPPSGSLGDLGPSEPPDELRRDVDRMAREAEADRKLEELKRRMRK